MSKQLKSKVNSEEVLKNQLARTLADYDNLVKRVEREKEELGKLVSLGLILKLLSVLDILESAQKHLNDSGLAIGVSEFKKVLTEEGLEEIRPQKGDKFDHNINEAIELISGGKSGEVAELILPGWKYKEGPVVRIAKVKVFGGK